MQEIYERLSQNDHERLLDRGKTVKQEILQKFPEAEKVAYSGKSDPIFSVISTSSTFLHIHVGEGISCGSCNRLCLDPHRLTYRGSRYR